PTCTSFHAALDALSEVVDEHDLDTNGIEKVIIRTTRGALKNNVGTNYDNISSAQMSMEYSVAAKIVDGEVGINQFTPARIEDLTLREMAGKVETVIDPELDAFGLDYRFAAQAIVLLDDKTRFESDYVHNPKRMTTEGVESKFITLANTAVNEEQGREIIESVNGIEKMRDVSNLADLLTVRDEE
ncbi:MAG: hypothetical protein GF309_01790, partial [Candidatus Lokiarchaeota archaeon]|nr:hypothetical protein [Candidatus Lokiarchaeota archaeon]